MASVIVCSSRLLRVRSPEIQHTPITKTTARTMLPTGRQKGSWNVRRINTLFLTTLSPSKSSNRKKCLLSYMSREFRRLAMKEFKHLPGLDLIRVFGILVVVFYHYQVETAVRGLCPADFLPAMEPLVQVAVYTMTLLSGSCLCWQEKSRSWSMKRYLWGRFLAIYPLFWLCFFPIFIYSDIICGNNEGVAPWKLLLSIVGVDGYFQSFTPTFYKIGEWYLGCILFLYAVFPVLWRMIRRRGVVFAAVGALFAWLACCFVENPGQLYPTLIGQLPLFFMGIFLGGCLPSLWIPGILAGMTTLVLYGLGCPEYWIVTAASVGVFVMVFYLGQLLLFCGPFLQKALHWLSRRCFGVFLVHHLAITLVIVPVLVNHRVTPLYWVSGLLLLTVGSFVISFLLDGLSRSIIKFLAERVVT